MGREKCKEHSNGYYDYHYYHDQSLSDVDNGGLDQETPPPSREPSPLIPPSLSSSTPTTTTRRFGCIEHPVSKLDTLAGIAIKYGVEVPDIKKMNGLVTDHQMFALKTLQIPLPGRHPPSPCLSNGSCAKGNSDHSPLDHAHSELLESFQSLGTKPSRRKVSPAMSSLQGYYGLKLTSKSSENSPFQPMSDRPLSLHRKSKSLVNVILREIMEKSDTVPAAEAREDDSDKWSDKLVRRRQKSEADFTSIPELLLRPDNSSSSGLPSRKGKGLALRPKATSRTAVATDSDSNGSSFVQINLGDASLTDGSSAVRKSSSTSSLHDQESSGSSSIWPTSRWNLKPDLQALTTAAIGKPIFDGLPKPLTGRRNKTALD